MANTTGKKFGGRKKGTPNKQHKAVKESILDAFEKLGGVEGLVQWGRENPTEFYRIYSKLIPVNMESTDGTMKPNVIELVGVGVTVEHDG